MEGFREGDRVRIDIPNKSDPDHAEFHGQHGTIVDILTDDAAKETGRPSDSVIYTIRLDNEVEMDFRARDVRPPLEDSS